MIVANLQPAKLMGVESNGMVLAASIDGEPSLLSVDPSRSGGNEGSSEFELRDCRRPVTRSSQHSTMTPANTALVVIDLQRGIVSRHTAAFLRPMSYAIGAARGRIPRSAGATVVLVNVAFAADKRDMLTPPVDSPNPPCTAARLVAARSGDRPARGRLP